MKSLSQDRSGLALAIIAVVIIVIIVIAVLAVIFLPFRDVTVNESKRSTLSDGLESLNFKLTIDHGTVEVRFVDSTTDAVSMTVSGHERSGLISTKAPVNVSWDQSIDGKSLTINSIVKLGGENGFFSSSRINCTINIAKQLKTSLTLTNNLGGIDVQTVDGMELTGATLKASTGGARLVLVQNTTLSGPLNMEASLGGVDLAWKNVNATGDIQVQLKAETGGVRTVFEQDVASIGNVTVGINTNVGGIDATVDIAGNVSGKVVSSAKTGGINVRDQTGFNGTSGQLESENFPTASQVSMTCTAQTGGVNLAVHYAA